MTSRSSRVHRAALGFRVKSGTAIAVLLTGPSGAPTVVEHLDVSLADPKSPASRQPYHAALRLPPSEETRIVAPLAQLVERCAARTIADLLARHREAGYDIVGAAVVVGSTIDPATIHNAHIRAHAADGRLFREAVDRALRDNGVAGTSLVEKVIYEEGSRVLRRSREALKRDLAALDRAGAGPWRSDHKVAALGAWIALVLASAKA